MTSMRKNASAKRFFFAHLAIEKMLKAFVTRSIHRVPPKTHNLIRLIELASLKCTIAQQDFLSRFNAYQIDMRYPDEMSILISSEKAQTDLNKAKEFMEWLINQL